MWTTPTQRVTLAAGAAGALTAAVVTAVWFGGADPHPVGGATDPAQALGKVHAGDCLNWPPGAPDGVSIVNCANEHRFEVAGWVDGERAPTQEISYQECQAAVQRYLGAHYDPNGRFTVGMLSTGDTPGAPPRMLCGLQWPGPGYQQLAFTGRVAELDPSKVWPAGTCLGITPATHQSDGVPVDCPAPHALEVTGAVNLADKFSGPAPADADQHAFLADACGRLSNGWLSPATLSTTGFALSYDTISAPSWAAGSRRVACTIGMRLGGGGWASLSGSAKGPVLVNGQPATPPPVATPTPTPSHAPSSAAAATTAPVRRTPQATPTPSATQADAPTGTVDSDNAPAGSPPDQPDSQPASQPPPPPSPPSEPPPPPAAPADSGQ